MRNVVALLAMLLILGPASAQGVRVFETLANRSDSPDVVTGQVVDRMEEAGYVILSTKEAGTEAECTGSVRVVSAWHPGSADALFALNDVTAPYALVERVAVFDDGNGSWISAVNPASVLKTVFLDDAAAEDVAAGRRSRLHAAIHADMERGYGQDRKRGKIGKTMGVMAGGPFNEKIGALATSEGMSVMEAADMISAGFDAQEGDWGMYLAYRLDLPERDLVVFGVSSEAMEAKSFAIVGAGSDKERKDIPCAGTAYAAAYPIEMVVRANEDGVVVESVEAMFRMKLFFEDAGKWAFMKNMTMPGSLASEMTGRVNGALSNGSL